MPTSQRLCVLLALVALFGSGREAAAQGENLGSQRVAIARLQFEGKVPEVSQELFAQRLIQGLTAAHFEVLPGRDVEQKIAASNQNLVGCQSASCYPAVASAVAASYLITAQVTESNKTYTMVLEIINGRTGGVLASNRERCETCGVEEAGEKMGLAASALRERLEVEARSPARLVIRSRPAGAAVVLDGKQTGFTPLDTSLPGGFHRMSVVLADHEPVSRSFSVVSGLEEAIDLDLVRIPSKFPYRTAGWSTLGGGVALFIAGIITMSADNGQISCSLEEKDIKGNCPYVRSTKWWGTALVAMGVAAATVGGTILYLEPARTPAGVGATANLAGRF
jgi:hypothetical protein